MPYMYLALTHSIKGKKIERSANAEPVALEKALDLQYAARNEYNRALACIKKDKAEKRSIIDDLAKRRVIIDLARVNLLIDKLLIDLNKEGLQEAQQAIDKVKQGLINALQAMPMVKQAIDKARLAIDKAKLDVDEAQQAIDKAKREAQQVIDEAQQVIKKGQELTNEITELTHVQILYHLACCYGIAYGIAKAQGEKNVDYQQAAYELLARSLVRNVQIMLNNTSIIDLDAIMDTGPRDTSIIEDPNWYYWRRVDSDLDFESIRNDNDSIGNGIETLKEKLRRKLLEKPSLLEEPEEMSKSINEIVKQITKIQ